MGIYGGKCVRCGKSLPHGQLCFQRTCADCVKRIADDPTTERRCPNDGNRMFREVLWDVVVHGCPACHKMWVDWEEMNSPNDPLGAAV